MNHLLAGMVLAFACTPRVSDINVINEAEFNDKAAHAIVNETLRVLNANPELISGWSLRLVPNNTGGCGGRGCTIFEQKLITVYAPSTTVVAELVCHEMVHVYLKATTGDSDSLHNRVDLFSINKGACAKVIEAFQE